MQAAGTSSINLANVPAHVFIVFGGGVWVWNVERRTLDRLTFDPATGFFPAWTPDGHRVLFSSGDASGGFGIFSKSPDEGGAAQTLATRPSGRMLVSDATDDRRRVIFSLAGRDVMALLLDGTNSVEPLVQTPFNERNGVVSRDGRWLAYESDRSGRFEVYVRPFPDDAGPWQVSTEGGTRPLWVPNRQELVYVALDGALMSVAVAPRGNTWNAGNPEKVIEGPYLTGGSVSGRTYDVSPDGRRFLLVKRPVNQPRPQIVVVQNWLEDLKTQGRASTTQ